MTLAVHFIACNTRVELIGVDPHQLRGLSGAGQVRRRVVELWDPSVDVLVSDIVMNDREIPEALSLMYEADEVHIHGIIPRIALKLVPQSKLEELKETPLVVHGPWTGTMDLLNNLGGDNEIVWPGPVRFDALARACWERDLGDGLDRHDATGCKAKREEDLPREFFFDVHRGPMVPHVRPRTPELLGEGCMVSIFVAGEYAEATRDAIVEQLEAHVVDDVQVELCHDRDATKLHASRQRRYAQLCVAPLMGYWSLSLTALGAIAQQVPLVVVGEQLDIEMPPGVVRVDDFEALGPFFSDCFARWQRGEVAPTDPAAARAWLLERLPR